MKGVVPRGGAGDWLMNTLSSCDTDSVDVVLFERLIKAGQIWIKKGSLRSRWSTATLMLNHPRGPQPDAALELFQHVNVHREDFFQTKDMPFDYSVARILVRTAQSLHKMARAKEAEEILDIFRRRLPNHYSGIVGIQKGQLNHRAVMRMLLDGDEVQPRSEPPSFDSARSKTILSNAMAIRQAAFRAQRGG